MDDMNGWQCVSRPLGIVLVLIPSLVMWYIIYTCVGESRVVIEFCCLKEELHSKLLPIGRALNTDNEV